MLFLRRPRPRGLRSALTRGCALSTSARTASHSSKVIWMPCTKYGSESSRPRTRPVERDDPPPSECPECGAPLRIEESVNSLVCDNESCKKHWASTGHPVIYCFSTRGLDHRAKAVPRPVGPLYRVCRRNRAYEVCREAGIRCYDCPFRSLKKKERGELSSP